MTVTYMNWDLTRNQIAPKFAVDAMAMVRHMEAIGRLSGAGRGRILGRVRFVTAAGSVLAM
jgi:hypothetical protein